MRLKIEPDFAWLERGAESPELFAILPRLEGARQWVKGALKVTPSAHNLGLLEGLPGVQVTDLRERRPSPPSTSTYQPKTVPYPHQLRAATHLDGTRFWALFMEQGTGKTKTLLDWAGRLFTSHQITGVIVVSKKGVHSQWIRDEVPKHFALEFAGEAWPTAQLPKGNGLHFFAINYDGLKTKAGSESAHRFAAAHQGKLLIIADESQEIKNAKSQRWKAMAALAKWSSHRALATGTPIAKDLVDEWAQLKWLNEDIIGIRYVTTFRAEYCIMGGYQGRAVVGHRNIDRFKTLTAPFVFRATKDDIGILPKQYATWTFDLDARQLKAMAEIKKELETALEDGTIVTAANAAVVLSKIQQASSGFLLKEEEVAMVLPPEANPRLNAMSDWLAADDELGKAIVWARFREELALISERLRRDDISFVEYHGGIKEKDRANAVASFRDPLGARVFVANAQSAGVGLNLQGLCRRALYFSNSFAAIDRWQSEDRIHRIGTVGSVTYTDLIANRSIDRYILNNLRRKKGLSNLVLGDISEMVSEL